MIFCKANNRRKVRLFDSLGQEVQALETRTLMAVFSANGGKGGTSGPLALEPGLNLVQFQWENFSIPDEFQIDYQGKRIAGDIGLRPNGEQGSKVIALKNTGSNLNIKVTAPLEGTAWNFRVETKPFELKVDGFLGDVIKVDIVNLLNKAGVSLPAADFKADGFGLKDLTFDQGEVARIDGMQDELKKGVFYFVPKVTGEALDYGANRADKGLGDITLTATNNGQEFPIKLRVSDGFSSTGDNAVTFGDKKLDIYRQEQRLAYLGFPGGASGDSLQVDGIDERVLRPSIGGLEWAQNLFCISIDPATSGRGLLLCPDGNSQVTPKIPPIKKSLFKEHINDSQLPFWRNFDGSLLPPMQFLSTQRTYGTDSAGRFIERARSELLRLGMAPDSTGIAFQRGTGEPSNSHDGGRGVDIDDTPGDYYKTTRGYVAASPDQGGGFIVKKADGTYRGGSNPVTNQGEAGLTDAAFKRGGKELARKLLDYLDYKLEEKNARLIIDAFINAGSPLVFYNDPRFFDVVSGVKYWVGHYNHIHFAIPSPLSMPGTFSVNAFQAMSESNDNSLFFSPLSFKPPGRLTNAIDLGVLNNSLDVSGNLTANEPERIYRFKIGAKPDDLESNYYDTPRDIMALLDNLASDVDLELIADPNYDDEGEVLFSSTNLGTQAESIPVPQLGSGNYFIRVMRKDTDTTYHLNLSAATLPISPDQAGETATNAASLGILTSPITRNDFIGEVDPQDLYNFQIDTISDVTLKVTGLDLADATLAVGQDTNGNGLLDSEEYISYSDADDNGDESIQLVRLPAGKYLLLVGRNSGNSNYQLNAAATSSVIPSDQAGDTTATSYDFGVLTAPVATTDFIGALDRVDTYRFRIDALQGIKAKLSSLTADADLEIYRDSNSDGLFDANERIGGSYLGGDSSEEIAMTGLAAGEYFIRVIQYESDSEYTLNVSPETATGANLVITRDYPGTTPDLGTQFAYRVTVTNNGPVTATDVILTEDLPVGLHLVRVDNINPSSSSQTIGNRITGRISSLEPGASASFDITAYAFIAGDLIGITNVASSTPDFDLSSNNVVTTNAINSIVSPPADLEITQSVSNQTPKVGDQITINLSLTNKGPGTATVIRVRDLLPAGLGYISFNSDIGTYDPITGLWAVGNLPPDVTVNLQISADVIQAVSMTNTVEVVAMDEADPDSIPNNNKTNEDDQSSTLIIPVGTPVEVALNVTKIERYGIHYQPTKLVLTFSTQLDTLSAQNKANYRILGPGGRYIPLSRATYQTSTTTVTLFPKLRLNLHKRYTLIVNGAQPTGLHTAQGAYLNHGTNHVAKIVQGNLVLPKIKKPQPVLRVALNAIKSKPIPSGKIIRALR